MKEEKQIEEMAIALSEGGCGDECDCVEGDKFNCLLLYNASVLYAKGYRKASEVAREIFDYIEALIEPNGDCLWRWDLDRLAELKKKFTEDEG